MPSPAANVPAPLAVLATTIAAVLGGCAGVVPVPTDVASPGMPNPEVALRQSMRTVEGQMAQLGGLAPRPIAAAALTTTAAPRAAGPVLPEPLQRTVSFDWNGPLDDGVARLARSVGYTYYLTAPRGTTPVEVAIRVRDVPAIEAFRALGEAAGSRATVRIVPSHSQVQVIYGG